MRGAIVANYSSNPCIAARWVLEMRDFGLERDLHAEKKERNRNRKSNDGN